MRFWSLHFALFLGLCGACGGPQTVTQGGGGDDREPPELHDEETATLARCQSLTEVLLAAPSSGNKDLMLTAHYAFESIYPDCLQALDVLMPEGDEHNLNVLAYGMLRLQSTRVGVEALYGMGEVERTCALLEEGVRQSNDFFEAINTTPQPVDSVAGERVLELRLMGLDTANFFDAAHDQVFDGACVPAPTAPEGQ